MGNLIEKLLFGIEPDENNVVTLYANKNNEYQMEQVRKFIFENDLVLDENGYYFFQDEFIHIVYEDDSEGE